MGGVKKLMGDYANDRHWSDRFLPTLQQLIGPLLLVPAAELEDRQHATDLTILTVRDMRIACRVRRPGYAQRYPRQFTIRSNRSNGTRTELAKILDGWGDWLFYGHAISDDLPVIEPWWIIDLHIFRAVQSEVPFEPVRNHDGTEGRAYRFEDFDTPCLLIASYKRPLGRSAAICHTRLNPVQPYRG